MRHTTSTRRSSTRPDCIPTEGTPTPTLGQGVLKPSVPPALARMNFHYVHQRDIMQENLTPTCRCVVPRSVRVLFPPRYRVTPSKLSKIPEN